MAKKKKAPSHAPRKKVTPKKLPDKWRPHATKRPQRGIRVRGTSKDARKRPVVVSATRRRVSRLVPRPVPQRSRIQPSLPREERTRLKHALDLVRRHVKGYSAQDGWGVKDLGGKTRDSRNRLLKKASILKELLRQPHELVKAPTAKARQNLYQFTRQKIRKAKHFIVHKPGDNFSVGIRRGRVVVRGKFEGKVRGKRRSKVVTESAFYLFPKTVKHPDDAELMLRDMLDEMPEGYYVMLTGAHGDTGEPADKGSLISKLRQYINAYQFVDTSVEDARGMPLKRVTVDQRFAQSIVGFRLLSTSVDGMELQMQARDIRRQRTAEYSERQRRAQMSKKEREDYEAPKQREIQRQAHRKAAAKGAAKRKAKAKKAKAKK